MTATASPGDSVKGHPDNRNESQNIPRDPESCSQNYHALFDQATDAIMVTDFNGNFKDVNAGACKMFGYTREELLQMNVSALLDTGHLNTKPIQFDLLMQGKNILNERKMLHRNGTIVYVESNAKKLNDNYIMAIARNITERKKVTQILEKSEADLSTIFETTDTVYVLMDNNFRILSYNSRAFAFAEKELGHCFAVSEYFLDYFPEEKKAGLQKNMRTVLTGQPVSYEVSYRQEDGSFNWYSVRMFAITKGVSPAYGLVMAASDITEKKHLEQELLKQKVQEQKRFTRAVVDAQEKERADIGRELHDNINQLLASSVLYLNHAMAATGTNPESLVKCNKYLLTAIDELRTLSHALVGPTQDKSMGLVTSLEELLHDISRLKQIRISFIHDSYREDESEVGLKLVIYRIIQEQLNNILKYAAASEIEIELKKENNQLTVTIHDNGKGFDPSVRRKGIGLTNIHNRAQTYNGRVQIFTSPGKGCRMKIQFSSPG
jgi:PAS domain S-box-containing protein